jgi:hypothetical protein
MCVTGTNFGVINSDKIPPSRQNFNSNILLYTIEHHNWIRLHSIFLSQRYKTLLQRLIFWQMQMKQSRIHPNIFLQKINFLAPKSTTYTKCCSLSLISKHFDVTHRVLNPASLAN